LAQDEASRRAKAPALERQSDDDASLSTIRIASLEDGDARTDVAGLTQAIEYLSAVPLMHARSAMLDLPEHTLSVALPKALTVLNDLALSFSSASTEVTATA
jgi:hypothetical protein